MHLQPISNIAEIFSRRNIKHVVISPGSRNAPLTIAFARHPEIKTYVIPDERSAGFIALGISQNLKVPVGVLCTSGTAAANLYPSVAEAFFQDTPLLVMTADRPPEWIDQWDGQTIYQENIYGKHVKASYNLPDDVMNAQSEEVLYGKVIAGIDVSVSLPQGPVHFNFPFREPFYPGKDENIEFSKILDIPEPTQSEYPELNSELRNELIHSWKNCDKKLILVGQHEYSSELVSILRKMDNTSIPIAGDIISNIHSLENAILHSDIFLQSSTKDKKDALVPKLLITIGKSVISKNLKLFLRNSNIEEHWHIQYGEKKRDPFKSITKLLNTNPDELLKTLSELTSDNEFINQKQRNYYDLWSRAESKTLGLLDSYIPEMKFGEFKATNQMVGSLPNNSILHLANSMPVRLANFCGLKNYQHIVVSANRGTSGIDGCTSTAMGFAITSEKPVILITGDMAFLYDRNAFWHNYSYPMLRVIVLNNHGGGIFRLISGPSDQPELEEFFETKQPLRAEPVAKEFDIEYYHANSEEQLNSIWKEFFNFDNKAKLLEIESESISNQKIFIDFKQKTKSLL